MALSALYSFSAVLLLARLHVLSLFEQLLFFWLKMFLGFALGKSAVDENLQEASNHLKFVDVLVLRGRSIVVEQHGSLTAPLNRLLDLFFGFSFLLQLVFSILLGLFLSLLQAVGNSSAQNTLDRIFKLKTLIKFQTYLPFPTFSFFQPLQSVLALPSFS